MKLLKHYFPELTNDQLELFRQLEKALIYWNERINVISRKDMEHLEERHLLHSLAIAKFISFKAGTRILDVGTGGGFPGLPLAIMFPECHFTLVDSIAKKIMVVNECKEASGIKNVRAFHARAESLSNTYDFIVSRAVSAMPKFYRMTKHLLKPAKDTSEMSGIIALKGGDLSAEISGFGSRVSSYNLSDWFIEEWFESKKLVHLRMR